MCLCILHDQIEQEYKSWLRNWLSVKRRLINGSLGRGTCRSQEQLQPDVYAVSSMLIHDDNLYTKRPGFSCIYTVFNVWENTSKSDVIYTSYSLIKKIALTLQEYVKIFKPVCKWKFVLLEFGLHIWKPVYSACLEELNFENVFPST